MSIASATSALDTRGYSIEVVDDFEQVLALFPQTGRQAQTPMMSIARLDLTTANAFWLFLRSADEVVGMLGCRSIELGEEPFDNYLRRTSRLQYERDEDPIEAIAAPVAKELCGQLIYIGELQFREEHRGSFEVLTAVADLAKGLSALRWPGFDWMYAFIPDEHFKLARCYGFSLHIPEAIRWKDPAPVGRKNSHWLMACRRDHYRHAVAAEMRGSIGRRRG
ncbi:MAG: hypothetical protein ACFB11_00620 [Paracoccaceae bacterium]